MDCGFIKFLGLDFGFWLLGSSDRGSPGCPKNLTFSLLCAGCHVVEKMTRNSDALKRDESAMTVMKVAFYPRGTSHLSDNTGVPGTGVEGSRDRLVSECQFQQPVGLCIEFDLIVYVCDAQSSVILKAVRNLYDSRQLVLQFYF